MSDAPRERAPASGPSLPKRVLFWAVLALVAAGVVELGVRAAGAAFFGWRVLAYGTRWHFGSARGPDLHENVAVHGNLVGPYSKYFPHERKWAIDARGTYQIRIDNHGFRGPDFEVAKRPGTIRVLTLGASSTFGFEDRDDETYPYFLQRALAHRTRGRQRFEVINFSVPHHDSRQILAMFLDEGLTLSPDVVTMYEGINDSKIAEAEGASGGWLGRLGQVSLAAELVTELRPSVGGIPTRAWNNDVVAAASRRYLGTLDALRTACEQHGIRFIVGTQQARSLMVEREALRGMPYAEEAKLVRERLPRMATRSLRDTVTFVGDDPEGRRAWLAGFVHAVTAASFVVHAGVMDAVRAWAAARHVELVDGIARLDRHRDSLVTWVHLDARGNKILAKALAARILEGAEPAQ